MVRERKEIPPEDLWDVEVFYPNLETWCSEFRSIYPEGKKTDERWPELLSYKGRLAEGPSAVKEAIELVLSLDRKLGKLFTYIHLKHDEELTQEEFKAALNRIMAAFNDFEQATSWIEPELLSLPNESLSKIIASPSILPYRFYLERIIRRKAHVLPTDQEKLLALAGRALNAPRSAFRVLNDTDFSFGVIQDSQGKQHELTHATFQLSLRSPDRALRQNAFQRMHNTYLSYQNTIGELFQGHVQTHVFHSRARGYPTCLHASLFPKNIDTEVYYALIRTVRQGMNVQQKYFALRKKILGIDRLHLYDLYAPLAKETKIHIPYEEAVTYTVDSVAPLGKEYQNFLHKGLTEDRWVDRYENKNKRSGAYSSGCYDSRPYILMNYEGTLRDVFTLAHEAGHSMHSLYSWKNQPYQYAHYPIFVAEVASTFNEELLMRHLLENLKGKDEKIYLLSEKIDEIRATFFRQTMFAEFELLAHTLAEQDEPITPQRMKSEYRRLLNDYFGDSVEIDPEAEIEWARIPHFYSDFYVYQYATGISAAIALTDRVLSGGIPERDAYLSFLRAGDSRYPLELLQHAGVDMRSSQPIEKTIQRFSDLVDNLASLTQKS